MSGCRINWVGGRLRAEFCGVVLTGRTRGPVKPKARQHFGLPALPPVARLAGEPYFAWQAQRIVTWRADFVAGAAFGEHRWMIAWHRSGILCFVL